MEISKAMIATTTSSSIRVKPFRLRPETIECANIPALLLDELPHYYEVYGRSGLTCMRQKMKLGGPHVVSVHNLHPNGHVAQDAVQALPYVHYRRVTSFAAMP